MTKTRDKGADLSEDFLNGSIAGQVEYDVFVGRVLAPVNLTQNRVRPVDVADSNYVDIDVQFLVDDTAVDSLQPWQRYITTSP